ncbi:MAG: glycosyltransferase [Desulfobacteraceae bacterium]|jgi:exo-beta-1,3-glucanase (GH17 family)/cellulose synthase/poly-beta-1,6-N-acetylglucosamine synthase-like glycosyltransferase
MNRSSAVIAISVAILTISVWGYLNQPEDEPPWPQRIQGFSFDPRRMEENSTSYRYPTEEEIDADLALLAGTTHAIRSYMVDGVHAKIPELAEKHGINVAIGAWLDGDLNQNELELERFLNVLGHAHNVVRAVVGNEAVLRNEIPVEIMIDYLDRVRKETDIPVSTAEPWHVWLEYPQLVDHVDYIAVHMLPFWEGIPMDAAVNYVIERMDELEECFPGKPIVISEVGWPSNGRTRKLAIASPSNQATFLRRFLERAEEENYIYYVMEAFDQPWKRISEGGVGAYWGVYDVERQPKFPFTEPIVPIPRWKILAGISVLMAIIALMVLFIDSKTLRNRGRGFLAIVAYALTTAAVLITYEYVNQYMTLDAILVGILMLIGMVGVILVLLTEAHEWAEAIWVRTRRRLILPEPIANTDHYPFVSIHVPAYNEPPDMLKRTLDALADLDYPAFEVIIIDNNTKDPNIWEPVRDHCQMLGERFRFFHKNPLSGFKAGALNYALKQTHPDVEIVAVIDSDYWVTPNWLKELVPYFKKDKIALVQAPQDYRDENESLFKSMCYEEYRGFFHIGMITRNERNAIIQHGTMTMVRKNVLEDTGAWSEWCITEDAELGLRIFEHGHEAIYIPKSYGKGVMPDSFQDFKKQRFRWAYGAIQILRCHIGELFGFNKTQLAPGQRYHFIAGWLPWIADGINLLFNFGALLWSLGMILAPKKVDPPLMELSLMPMAFFIFKAAKMLWLYRTRVKANSFQTIAAGLAGLALAHTIAKAVLTGFCTRNLPFFRTPKWAQKHAFLNAMTSVWQETLMLLALWGAAAGVYLRQLIDNPDTNIWIFVLLLQSLAYFSSVLVAVISGLPNLSTRFIGTTSEDMNT